MQKMYDIISDINNIAYGFTGIPQLYSINIYWYPIHKQFRFQLLKMTETNTYQHEYSYKFMIEGDFHNADALHSYLKTHKKELTQQFMRVEK